LRLGLGQLAAGLLRFGGGRRSGLQIDELLFQELIFRAQGGGGFGIRV
jgi:hypothetical protein